jgi:hypothetical protein
VKKNKRKIRLKKRKKKEVKRNKIDKKILVEENNKCSVLVTVP